MTDANVGEPSLDARSAAPPATDASASLDASVDAETRPDAFSVSALDGACVAYQVDPAHTGNQPASHLKTPLTLAWSIDLANLGAAVGAVVSYPLIVGGRIFVTFQSNRGAAIEAIDLQTGNRLWGPLPSSNSGLVTWANAAYDSGRVYLVNGDGLLTALDPSTGATIWTKQMPGQYAFSAPPTATGGMVFIGGAGEGGTIYGVDGESGQVVWTGPVNGGIDSSPAVTSDAVYASDTCLDAYAFNPLDGALLWHHKGTCNGAGIATLVAYQEQVSVGYSDADTLVLDAKTGSQLEMFKASSTPAFAGQREFVQFRGQLQALDVTTRATQWTFDGDGMLASAPLVVNGTVFVGSSTGAIFGVDSATGAQIWKDVAPAGVTEYESETLGFGPIPGLGAGEDSLVVPAGSHLLCYR
jgi:outer membrane protein assembly factor BamB